MRGITVLGLLAAVTLTGCGGSTNNRVAVSGRVLFKDEPLDQGTISFFHPVDAKSPYATALIHDGRYDLPALQGLEPGSYRVEVNSDEPISVTPAEYAAGKSAMAELERISAAFNKESKMTVDVRAGRANKLDFVVK